MSGWQDYSQHVKLVVGQGNRVHFWKDKWCGDTALMDRFPILFSCSTQCDAIIENVLTGPNPRRVREWNVSFVRGFNDWEVVVVVEFFDFLYSIAEPKGGVDGLRWKLCKDGVFDSRSFYLALSSRPGVRFPWKSIWAAKAPPRVAFFIWITA